MRIKKHIGYYLFLLLILTGGFFLATQFSYDRKFQISSILLTAIFYVIWGIIHHLINHDLTTKIVVEYILMGSLGVTVVLFLLKGGI